MSIKYQFLRISLMIKSSFEYFIGYSDNDDIRPLCIKLPQMTGYVKCFDSNKAMPFNVINKKILDKYSK